MGQTLLCVGPQLPPPAECCSDKAKNEVTGEIAGERELYLHCWREFYQK
jgi:hypothetical protein